MIDLVHLEIIWQIDSIVCIFHKIHLFVHSVGLASWKLSFVLAKNDETQFGFVFNSSRELLQIVLILKLMNECTSQIKARTFTGSPSIRANRVQINSSWDIIWFVGFFLLLFLIHVAQKENALFVCIYRAYTQPYQNESNKNCLFNDSFFFVCFLRGLSTHTHAHADDARAREIMKKKERIFPFHFSDVLWMNSTRCDPLKTKTKKYLRIEGFVSIPYLRSDSLREQ